jgi:hypothetical protein
MEESQAVGSGNIPHIDQSKPQLGAFRREFTLENILMVSPSD